MPSRMRLLPRTRLLVVLPVLALASTLVIPTRAEAPAFAGGSHWPMEASFYNPDEPLNSQVLFAPPGANIPLGATVEPTVAVDPNNPLRVAAASLFSIRVSTDGGVTFQPTVAAQVPATHGLCGDPSVGYDSQGRLFWTYLGCRGGGIDMFIAQISPTTGAILPGYPVNITAAIGLPAPANAHDKEWLAVDHWAGSPYRDNLYVAWSDLTGASAIRVVTSTDQGLNWSAPVTLSGGGEGFVWPVHNTVAPNGDVYVSYHAPASNGTAGRVYLLRSTDGGVSFPQKTNPYGAGQADVTFNVQSQAGAIPGTQFWLQGNGQAYVLADPNVAGRIYVVASDDPDNDHTTGDPSNVYIATSNNFGVNFGAPVRIDDGPGNTFQVMPSAGIDTGNGCMVVHWYDNRSGATNAGGDFLLDVYARASGDGGVTWGPSIKLNDVPFDPVAGARCRYGPVGCGDFDTVNTLRIGEYNGVATANGVGFAVWGGNTFDGGGNAIGQQTIFDRFAFDSMKPAMTCPSDISLECTQHGGVPKTNPAIVAFLNVTATDNCDTNVPVTNNAPALFPLGTTTVTFMATDDAGNTETCTADVTIEDTTDPTITYCPVDMTVECTSHCGVPKAELAAWLAGFAAEDLCDADPDLTNDAPDCFPLGPTVVTFTATDESGNFAQCQATITVEDTTPPEIDVVLDRDVLWPPNHKLVEVCIETISVTDICDPNPTWVLWNAESDEPDNGKGDGNSNDDIQGDVTGTPDPCLDLRSERQGGGDGRKYTIYYQAMDMSGNVAYDTVCVRVPHDQSASALAALGYSPDGRSLSSNSDKFALVIPTTDNVDAALLDVSRIYLGNTAGVIKANEARVVDVTDDGRPDLALFYSTEALTASSSSYNMDGSDSAIKRDRGDGPQGLHYTSVSGVDYLVSDIFALGTPVVVPGGGGIVPLPGAPDVQPEPVIAKETAFSSVHPNPFNPQTTVGYTLAGPARVRIAIYDVRGSLVRLLVDASQPAGSHNAVWNGVDDSGRSLTSGIYFVRMIAGSYVETRKIVMLK
ncbi:MAG: HYR domain-containing protein [Candidatus Krumholzibacteria bacterium]|nr:HYR domain-containing protein [Candidatus Krumholzibacteria bacterium]MDH5269846.1 HYR domain-containing protein [Candidatus Krumholzibacteria bacterium]